MVARQAEPGYGDQPAIPGCWRRPGASESWPTKPSGKRSHRHPPPDHVLRGNPGDDEVRPFPRPVVQRLSETSSGSTRQGPASDDRADVAGARPRRWDSNLLFSSSGAGSCCEGASTCRFSMPVVTARARRGPWVPGVVRTQRGPGALVLADALGAPVLRDYSGIVGSVPARRISPAAPSQCTSAYSV